VRRVDARNNWTAVFFLHTAVFAIAAMASSGAIAPYVETRTGMRFMLIPAGSFRMGSPESESGHNATERAHEVRIPRSFYIGTCEVTQRQWIAVMGKNPSHFHGSVDLPVEGVNWFEVHEFIKRLNALSGEHFRLPTEAEWEYACRAGTQTPYAFGKVLSTADANYDGRYPLPGQAKGEYRGRPMPVASLRANAWGLFDMHGNVWEWCEDEYCPDVTVGHCNSNLKVIRGGSWYFNADSARSALRYWHRPQDRGFSLGFRLVRD
jgi:formylglycine-generating enzyme required for sulfatase activity